jgi:hypothetical protein
MRVWWRLYSPEPILSHCAGYARDLVGNGGHQPGVGIERDLQHGQGCGHIRYTFNGQKKRERSKQSINVEKEKRKGDIQAEKASWHTRYTWHT